jgi:hypothetical protein
MMDAIGERLVEVYLAAAQQGVAADERRRSAFGLPLALAAERRYVSRAK